MLKPYFRVLGLRTICLCLTVLFFALNHMAQAQSLPWPLAGTQAAFASFADITQQRWEPQQDVRDEKPARFLKAAGIVAAGAAVWTATYLYVDEPLQQFAQSHRNAVADKVAQVVTPLGRQKYLMPAAGAALVGGLLAKDEKLQEAGVISAGSILVNAGLTTTLKKTFRRHRPSSSTENDLFDGPSNKTTNSSLPSSHTATAFAVATSVATVYQDSKYVPPIAYGAATLVGLARINDNAHWATDVMAAAAVGYLSSKGVSYLYKLADKKLKSRKQTLLITPQVGLTAAGISSTFVF